MSKISTIYDTLLTTLAALYPDKTRLPNPYLLERNNIQFLQDGWGLKVSPSSATIDILKEHQEAREFAIVFTREVIGDDINSTAMDDQTKNILEDAKTLAIDFLNPDQLGIADTITKVEFVSNSGVNFIDVNEKRLISTETIFTIDIEENI